MQVEEVVESAIKSARELHILKCGSRDPRKCGCSLKFSELRELANDIYAKEIKVRNQVLQEMEKIRKEIINDNEQKSRDVVYIDLIFKAFIVALAGYNFYDNPLT